MVIRTLTSADFDAALRAFNGAFSDYLVPFQLSREQLAEMLRRRGWVPEASVAAFEGEEIIAFTLNAVEGDRAYDSGTGVVPSQRRRGLARELMLRSFDVLRERGCTSYVLEVLEENVKAAELYRSLGFAETRKLQCWTCSVGPGAQAESLRHTGSREAHTTRREWWDVEPSWQNTIASVNRAGDEHLLIGSDDGYAIVFPSNGDVPQLAVRPLARRRGIGTRLLREAAAIAGKPLRIMNVDDRDAGIAAFLARSGAAPLVRQLDMRLAL
jgi:ribosomal protein S18 acetylase RimI-like enzyme